MFRLPERALGCIRNVLWTLVDEEALVGSEGFYVNFCREINLLGSAEEEREVI